MDKLKFEEKVPLLSYDVTKTKEIMSKILNYKHEELYKIDNVRVRANDERIIEYLRSRGLPCIYDNRRGVLAFEYTVYLEEHGDPLKWRFDDTLMDFEKVFDFLDKISRDIERMVEKYEILELKFD